MSDPDHANPDPSPPTASADEQDLQSEVDQLLDDVDALTKETLGESEPSEARAPAKVPTTDPAKEIVADDVGLSGESALIQDGGHTPVEEVAADVDSELDQMERLISGIGGSGPPADPESSDQADAAATIPAVAPDSEPPTDPLNTIASDADVIESLPQEQAAPEPAVDVGTDSNLPELDDAEDTGLDDDIAEIVAASLHDEPPTDPDALIAGQIPSDPESLLHAESAKETSLDDDLDSLLASSEVSDLEAPLTADASPADPAEPPATTAGAAPKPAAESHSGIDLESISIWRLLKLKLKSKSRYLGLFIGRKATNALVWLLDRVDAKIGNKLPPMAREMVGYCALATLAMSIIALIILFI